MFKTTANAKTGLIALARLVRIKVTRREVSTVGGLGGNTLDFEYDGSTMIGWTGSAGSYDFMIFPGGGVLHRVVFSLRLATFSRQHR